jgi:5'-3' exonuclease
MLVHFGVTPYLVFDGDRLPSKAGTEKSRRDRRKEAREAGMELSRMGKRSEAHQELQKAVDITPEIARALIEELKRNNVQYIVAPYEADSQMAYLEKKGIIDAILSEDSDLLCFGARTLLTKLDQYGDCVMIKQDDFTACRDVNLVGWTCDDFRRMCILSGCDYLDSISKMGLKTAHRLLQKYHKKVEKLIRGIQLEGKMKVPPGYAEAFIQAEKTFLYQWVYCPVAKRMVNLTEPETEDVIDGLTYIGRYTEPEMASQLAAGDLNPMTKEPIIVTATASSSYYKRTPLLQRSKTVDSSKHPKIDSFFKKRTPLAELNVNNFTPSPSQQRILANNANREWQTESIDRTSSAPSRAAQARPVLLERTTSAPNLKRQRLCTEGEDTESAKTSETQRSKFFRSSTYQPSPLGGEGASKNRTNRHGFNLWSDDSIDEEAMAKLTEMPMQRHGAPGDSVHKRVREFQVHAESEQSPTPMVPARTSAAGELVEVLNLPIEHSYADPFSSSLKTEAGSFKDRFSFTGLPTPPLTNTQSSVNASSSMVEPATPPHIEAPRVEETPYNAQDESVLKDLPSREASPLQARNVSSGMRGKKALMEILSQHSSAAKGSEDLMIVPDSEADMEQELRDEDEQRECCEDEDEDSDTLPTFGDLGRFAFSEVL